jgi:predicted phage-related endonuclease
MKTIDAPQGSPGWHAHRATARNASEAPAVLGCSPYTTRAQMLHARHTGIRPEVTAPVQARFDAGHAIEAAQMAGAEAVIGEPLFPVVGSAVVDGIELSASFDGLTMDESTAYECKTSNDALRAVLTAGGDPEGNDGRALPKHYRVQMEQQLAVCGGDRVLFVAADRDGADVRRCWYYPDMELRAEILAAWRQFDADLATYTPPAAAEKVVAEPVEALPAVSVTVTGTLALADNFDAFERALRTFLADRLIREPQTDQDFADLGLQIKAMKKAEDALDAAESQMLAQVETVDQAKRRKDTLKKLVRDNRLMAEKLLTSEKERRKGELVAEGVTALRAHVAKLNERLGDSLMPATATAADFGGAIKGLSSLDSMRDKIGVLLAQAKIAASDVADKIEANVKALAAVAPEHAALFPDRSAIVLKAPEDCATLIRARVAEHDAAVKRRAEEAAERERERIRREEAARVEREAQERAAAERRQQEAAAAAERAAQAAAVPPAPAPTYPPAAPSQVYATGPANVVPMPTKAPAATATLIKLGAINERIAPLSIDAAGLAALGFQPATTQGAAKMYAERDLPRMLAAMLQHIGAVQAKLAA